ncbi:winged helix-turn-helix domain-containing protein [Egibacter rhizosphaerae]|uniref:Winged helix-turn-helix domain-containing protein n=1 Tax=Egibacter rhizosphaerae TaxID=1670831 RepID=A0A411YLC8_9ACTN|nr:winged helix-turn-helix domain-containing protein [Egibacter rhizosphaerae]
MSRAQARGVALAAQGFADASPSGRVDARHLRRVLARTQVLQIDSVSAVARAHYFPAFSRLGPYPRGLVDDLAYRRRELFEYWVHEASLAPVDLHPLLRWRMRRFGYRPASRVLADAPAGWLDAVEQAIREGGPATAAEIEGHRAARGPWWDWSEVKAACEELFGRGRLAVRERRGFVRVYDLAGRVVPEGVLAAPTPSEPDAHAALVERAARAHGVATTGDLADYFRLRKGEARVAVDRLVEEGRLEPVAVEGLDGEAYLHAEARVPRRVEACTLLAPFDPVVWYRPRARWLFGFDYRIEIYTPAAKREYGYYVLPLLLGDQLVARADVRADRANGTLRVPGAFAEPAADPGSAADGLRDALGRLATWLGLERVEPGDRGDLVGRLGA